MSILKDPYYDRSETSNSDLGWLEKYWLPQSFIIDLEAVFRFGSLVDAMITEPEQVDYFKMTVAGISYNKDEFKMAAELKKIFFADSFCKSLAAQCELQKVSTNQVFTINYNGFVFNLSVRCKWDFFASRIDLCGDLKTTASTTQKEFEKSIFHYNYDRQAAFYMDIENKSNFIFIGISKKNGKIFKVIVRRGDAIYNSGKAKYEELAFRYFYLFGNVNHASKC
jgi:hypothetical protein